MRFSQLVPWAITLGAAAPLQQLPAQAGHPTVVRVQVADSNGAPLEGADITIRSGLRVVDRGITDAAGRRVLVVSRDTGEFQLIVRRLGFHFAEQFFRATTADTMSFAFYLTPVVRVLDPVKVTAKEDRRHQYLFADGATIAGSGEDIQDGVDVVRKLRPRMAKGLALGAGWCGPTRDVWVNGQIIRWWLVPMDNYLDVINRYRDGWGIPGMAGHVLIVLSKIKPEHIAQMRRVDCDETSAVPGHPLGAADAIFVVLKPGIGFDVDKGSYVVNWTEFSSRP